MNRLAVVLFAGATLTTLGLLAATARADDKKKDERYRACYDVRDLIDRRMRMATGLRSGPLEAEQLLRFLRGDDADVWIGPADRRADMQVLNNHWLEVHASANLHKDIEEMLALLRSIHDIDVRCDSWFYEVDAVFFEKSIKPVLADDNSPLGLHAVAVGEQLAESLRKHGRPAAPMHTQIIASSDEAKVLSLRLPHFYRDAPGAKHLTAAFSGVTVTAGALPSADRRAVNLQLTQTARNLKGTSTKNLPDADGNLVALEVPRIEEAKCTETVTVDDGTLVLVPVHLRPAARGKVYVLLVRSTILIKAEQRFFLESRLQSIWARLYYWLKIADAVAEVDRIPGVREFIIRWLDRGGL